MLFTVKTTGVSTMTPNLMKFTFNFSYRNVNYNQVVEETAKKIVDFYKAMKKYAKPTDFKTLRYRVSRETKRIEKGRNDYEYVFSHYQSYQTVHLSLPYDKTILFTIMQMVSEMGDDAPAFDFSFGLTNESIAELENECTEKALLLAKEKAEATRKSLGFQTVAYKSASIVEEFETDRFLRSNVQYECVRSCKMSAEEMAESMDPEDVRVSINVISEFDIV